MTFNSGQIQSPSLNFDGIFYCKVLEIVPFKKLSYSWKGGPGDGRITLDSKVVWKLEPKDKGTELFLEHSGFSEIENLAIYNGMTDGWLKNLQKIADLLNAATTWHNQRLMLSRSSPTQAGGRC